MKVYIDIFHMQLIHKVTQCNFDKHTL